MPNREIEDKLVETLIQQIAIYHAALPLAEQLAESYDLGPTAQKKLEELDALVLRSSVNDRSIVELRDQYLSSCGSLNARVTKASTELAKLIERMIELFGKIEGRAGAAKDHLYPKVSNIVQARRMHAAYQSHHPSNAPN